MFVHPTRDIERAFGDPDTLAGGRLHGRQMRGGLAIAGDDDFRLGASFHHLYLAGEAGFGFEHIAGVRHGFLSQTRLT